MKNMKKMGMLFLAMSAMLCGQQMQGVARTITNLTGYDIEVYTKLYSQYSINTTLVKAGETEKLYYEGNGQPIEGIGFTGKSTMFEQSTEPEWKRPYKILPWNSRFRGEANKLNFVVRKMSNEEIENNKAKHEPHGIPFYHAEYLIEGNPL